MLSRIDAGGSALVSPALPALLVRFAPKGRTGAILGHWDGENGWTRLRVRVFGSGVGVSPSRDRFRAGFLGWDRIGWGGVAPKMEKTFSMTLLRWAT